MSTAAVREAAAAGAEAEAAGAEVVRAEAAMAVEEQAAEAAEAAAEAEEEEAHAEAYDDVGAKAAVPDCCGSAWPRSRSCNPLSQSRLGNTTKSRRSPRSSRAEPRRRGALSCRH
jgi:hypothetical protein